MICFQTIYKILMMKKKKEKELELSRIIYVGISRAKENLIISHCGELLNIIPKDNNICNFYVGK